jgi:hypothetical protein
MRKISKVSAISDVAVLERPVVRTAALEACYYPVDPINNLFDGSLDSTLHGPVTLPLAVDVFPNPATFFLLGKISTKTVEIPFKEPEDVLAPYYGKDVAVVIFLGMDNGKEIEYGHGLAKGQDARNIAARLAQSSKRPIRLKDANTGTLIDVVSVSKGTRATSTRTATVTKSVKVLTPEEIEAQALEKWRADYAAAVKENAKFDAKAAKEKADLLASLVKALAAKENEAQRALFTREQGATPKEQNYAWNARNPDKVAEKGVANFGWNQRGQEMVWATRDENGNLTEILVTRLRPCEASLAEGVKRLGPAFKIIPVNAPLNGWEPVPFTIKKK